MPGVLINAVSLLVLQVAALVGVATLVRSLTCVVIARLLLWRSGHGGSAPIYRSVVAAELQLGPDLTTRAVHRVHVHVGGSGLDGVHELAELTAAMP